MSENLIQEILNILEPHRNDRDFNRIVTALLFEINALTRNRFNVSEIIQRMYERLNEEIPQDTRITSPAHNYLAPIAASISELDMVLQIAREQVSVLTASGAELDAFGADYRIERGQATHAIRTGLTYNRERERVMFPIASRLQSANTDEPIIFELIGYEGEKALLRAKSAGTIGHSYIGKLLQVSNINNFGSAEITGTQMPGQNRESDEDYRRRLIQSLRLKQYGGNVADYLTFMQNIDGVQAVMVFPVWRGYNTTKVDILDSNYNPVTDEFIDIVQEMVDPRPGAGFGIAPIGHNVTVSTSSVENINFGIRAVLAHGITPEQISPQLETILASHIDRMKRNVVSEWERTYFANDGIAVTPKGFQTHTWNIVLSPQIIGVELLNTGLIAAIDFTNFTINGEIDPNGYVIVQTQEETIIPQFNSANFTYVDYI